MRRVYSSPFNPSELLVGEGLKRGLGEKLAAGIAASLRPVMRMALNTPDAAAAAASTASGPLAICSRPTASPTATASTFLHLLLLLLFQLPQLPVVFGSTYARCSLQLPAMVLHGPCADDGHMCEVCHAMWRCAEGAVYVFVCVCVHRLGGASGVVVCVGDVSCV